jgi:two-component system chemotaxis response regulator CheB
VNHDIVAIGASAGGFEVLLEVVRELPADLRAAIFVVVHVAPGQASSLPELLGERGVLPARHPLHEETIVPGTIYVAPPDMHLQVRPGAIDVVRGPKDNGHRPAADVLFRTAAAAYGSRVIGVVLSGYHDCGTAGMMAIKAHGGISVVQDPATALVPEMPANVLQKVDADHVVRPPELAELLVRLVASPAILAPESDHPEPPADVTCPICHGLLTEAQPGVFQHSGDPFGHPRSLEQLVREHSQEMERVMWAAVRALEETAALARRISLQESGEMRKRFDEKAETTLAQADYLRKVLLGATGAARSRAPARADRSEPASRGGTRSPPRALARRPRRERNR